MVLAGRRGQGAGCRSGDRLHPIEEGDPILDPAPLLSFCFTPHRRSSWSSTPSVRWRGTARRWRGRRRAAERRLALIVSAGAASLKLSAAAGRQRGAACEGLRGRAKQPAASKARLPPLPRRRSAMPPRPGGRKRRRRGGPRLQRTHPRSAACRTSPVSPLRGCFWHPLAAAPGALWLPLVAPPPPPPAGGSLG